MRGGITRHRVETWFTACIARGSEKSQRSGTRTRLLGWIVIGSIRNSASQARLASNYGWFRLKIEYEGWISQRKNTFRDETLTSLFIYRIERKGEAKAKRSTSLIEFNRFFFFFFFLVKRSPRPIFNSTPWPVNARRDNIRTKHATFFRSDPVFRAIPVTPLWNPCAAFYAKRKRYTT